MSWLRKVKTGENHLVFKEFECYLDGKRYSGEMDTSLSNSLVNLMFVLFILHKSGHEESFYVDHCPPQIEGDDCLAAHLYDLDPNIMIRLGARAKLEFYEHFSQASFCGMVFSEHSVNIIRDPISAILDFGYVHFKYLGCSNNTRLKLIRAKSLSLLYSYPGCPILKSLAMYGLRITEGITNRRAVSKYLRGETDVYKRNLMKRAAEQAEYLKNVEVSGLSRQLMETKFGVSEDNQKALELYLDGLLQLTALKHPALTELSGAERNLYFDMNHRKIEEVTDSIRTYNTANKNSFFWFL